MNYVELHARSAFSFLEGACVPEELAGACADSGMPAMAIMDRNGVYGAPLRSAEFVRRLLGRRARELSPEIRTDPESIGTEDMTSLL